eukprot:12821-Heterococcus_DN1.PRE.2
MLPSGSGRAPCCTPRRLLERRVGTGGASASGTGGVTGSVNECRGLELMRRWCEPACCQRYHNFSRMRVIDSMLLSIDISIVSFVAECIIVHALRPR